MCMQCEVDEMVKSQDVLKCRGCGVIIGVKFIFFPELGVDCICIRCGMHIVAKSFLKRGYDTPVIEISLNNHLMN